MATKKVKKEIAQEVTIVKRKFVTRRRVVISLLLLTTVSLIWFFFIRKPPQEVEISRVKLGSIRESISTSGKVQAEESVTLTFQTSGKLVDVRVRTGDKIKKGQVIASLDKKQIELSLKKLLNIFEKEFTEFDDTNDSVEDKVLTDAVRRIKKRAQIDLDQTVLDVEIHNEAISLATLFAPFSGIVTKAEPGYPGVNVAPGAATYVIVNPDTVYLEAEVNETDVVKLKEDQNVVISLDAYPAETYFGKIKSIDFDSTTTSTGGTAYKVRVNLPLNDSLKFRLGMSGDADFIINQKENIITVAQTAIFEEEGKNFVWVVDEKNRARKREVKQSLSSLDEVEVVGLFPNEKIIDQPSNNIKEGDKVKLN